MFARLHIQYGAGTCKKGYLFLSLAPLSTRTLATTTYFFLSRKGFFDQWLISELLEGCVAIWDGKTHVRCVHVYITISEHNKVSDKTLMLQPRGYRQS